MVETILMACGCVSTSHRTVDGEQVPSCIVHRTIEQAPKKPSLEGRRARCAYGGKEVDSSYELPFFEFKGEGSRASTETCKHCRYYECAHEHDPKRVEPRGRVERGLCKGFEPMGAFEFDTYYCGCRGWD